MRDHGAQVSSRRRAADRQPADVQVEFAHLGSDLRIELVSVDIFK